MTTKITLSILAAALSLPGVAEVKEDQTLSPRQAISEDQIIQSYEQLAQLGPHQFAMNHESVMQQLLDRHCSDRQSPPAPGLTSSLDELERVGYLGSEETGLEMMFRQKCSAWLHRSAQFASGYPSINFENEEILGILDHLQRPSAQQSLELNCSLHAKGTRNSSEFIAANAEIYDRVIASENELRTRFGYNRGFLAHQNTAFFACLSSFYEQRLQNTIVTSTEVNGDNTIGFNNDEAR
ncbi:MAG: hypothetical protein HRT45_05230 [Bdellovibrionales bacterium]|nr:hypothetical protein [Bdellovibrionales bacterium]